MDSLDLLAFAPAAAGILAGLYFSWKAYDRLSDSGFRRQVPAFWILGSAGRPEDFTAEGWRYRTLAMWIPLVGVLVSVIFWFAAG